MSKEDPEELAEKEESFEVIDSMSDEERKNEAPDIDDKQH